MASPSSAGSRPRDASAWRLWPFPSAPLHMGLPWVPGAPDSSVLCADGLWGGREDATREPGGQPPGPCSPACPLGAGSPAVILGALRACGCALWGDCRLKEQGGVLGCGPSCSPSFPGWCSSTCSSVPAPGPAPGTSHDAPCLEPSLPALGSPHCPQGSAPLALGRGVSAGHSTPPALPPPPALSPSLAALSLERSLELHRRLLPRVPHALCCSHCT